MQRRHWFLSAAFVSLTVGALAACNSDDDDPAAVDAGATDAPADHTTAHDTGTPQTDANVADTNVADTNVNVPDTNVNVPDTNVPDTNVSDTNVSDTSTHDANVPDTNLADTNVPDTNVPDTNVPDTNVSDTSTHDASDGGTADASDGATSACLLGDAGYLVVPKDWSFAVSAATDGGKGQVFTINRCDSVLWTNTDIGIPHSVVSTGGGFTFSTTQNSGGAYAPIQFPQAGTFTYECGVHHQMMIGQITVQ